MRAKEFAYSYLVNSYNSTLGLCYEYPDSNVYWVTNDNVLASYALQQWNREIADNITETIERIANEYGLLTSQAGVPLNCRAEILLGYDVELLFNMTENITLNESYCGSVLKTDIATNDIVTSFEDYADLLCYASLVEGRNENYSGADYYYGKVEEMWDGKGFKDAIFYNTSYYATYKLGLFYLVNKMSNKGSFWFEKQLVERMWQCQDSNGGFKTDYYENGSFPIECKTNTETTSIILLSEIPCPSPAYEEKMEVGAYYYIWWGIPFNNHWDHGTKYTPFVGKYNSSDSLTADRHILWAIQHRIDFFAVSWLGEGEWLDWDYDYIDQNLKNGLLKAGHISSFKFCLLYESEIVLNDALNATLNPDQNFTKIFIEDMTYATQEYFNNPSYLKIDEKPVVFIYNLPYIYGQLGTTEAQNLFDALRQRLDVYLVGDVGSNCTSPHDVNSALLYSMNATTNYFFAHTNVSEGWSNITEYAKKYYPEWRYLMNSNGIKFIPNVYGGYDNTEYCRWKNDSSQPTVLPFNETMFEEMLTTALGYADNDLQMVMITSWNEWLESTAIEPSMEFGELFLHTIYDVIPEFPSFLILPLCVFLTILAVAYSKKRLKIMKP
ncbi:MAG: glycoside hydrolase family 99-like domain-containing protein [Candidatus Bathyarchaeota archaeon]|nr:glycoside hydrolase family 99-like domain-containing protein [Candidatus Bathyarchaeota archaeon]